MSGFEIENYNNMKTYINAELEILSMSNDIIATSTTLGINSNVNIEEDQIQTSGRCSIWD